MNKYQRVTSTALSLFVLLAGTGYAQPAEDQATDTFNRAVDQLLEQVVTQDGLVRYEILIENPQELARLVKTLERERNFKSQQEKMAFYINAYNLAVLQQVVDHWPLESVMTVKGFFDQKKYHVNGRAVTLNDIENKIIRPLGDARIHSALVCAAVSCPPLRSEAYTTDKLGKQLTQNTQRWLADERKNTADEKRLIVSKIFQWYAEDFNNQETISLASFLRHYAAEQTKVGRFLAKNQGPIEIEYMAYDWSLNIATKDDKKP